MPAPLVSICIPAYKAASFIGETLASIRAQTFADWELIVIEDGSHDATESLVRAFARTVSQPVHFHRHPANQGLPGTRNTAISRSSGEWIALIDADDLWTPEHLTVSLARAKQTSADLIHTGVILFDSDTGRDEGIRAPDESAKADFPRSLYLGNYAIQPSSALIRTRLCRQVGGFDPTCRYVEDREFWIRLVRAGAKIAYEPTLTCRYRQHAQAMTKNSAAMAEGVAGVYERHLDWSDMPKALRLERTADAWLAAGRILLRSNPRRARTHFARALRHRPLSLALLTYWSTAALLGIFKKQPA